MSVTITYLVHDLNDAAVHRRIRMFKNGGARLQLAGFRRSNAPFASPDGDSVVDLGETADQALAARVGSVAKVMTHLEPLSGCFKDADVVVARNLEMLAIAVRAKQRFAPHAKLVYECLDIHRLLLSERVPGRLIRRLETALMKHVDLILTSSPAFVTNYFAKRGVGNGIEIVENKVLCHEVIDRPPASRPLPGPPWKIGYFGMLRCQKSVQILADVAKAMAGKVEIIIRGKPSPAIFPDLAAECAKMEHVSFLGPYKGAGDLAKIYSEVHFAWAIDYYEEGLNSSWLLPNRLYEASFFGAVPLALADVETGRWLASHKAGVLLPHPPGEALIEFFSTLDSARYTELTHKILTIPSDALACDHDECRRLVTLLSAPAAGKRGREIKLAKLVTHNSKSS